MTTRLCLRAVWVGLLLPGLLAAQVTTSTAAAAVAPRMLPVPTHVVPPDKLANVGTGPATPSRRSTVASEDAGSNGWPRRAVLLSAGLALTSGAVAYWSTREADKAYDRYLRSAGAGRQQRALDDAETHDRIAGASFLLMEAGIVLTTRYLFF